MTAKELYGALILHHATEAPIFGRAIIEEV